MSANPVTTRRTALHATLLTTGLLLAGLSTACAGHTLPSAHLADVKITNRSTGEALPVYQHEGELWVAGRPGASYGVDITNRTGRRILAVISVDGVNVLNGQTASATPDDGYVFNPWQNWSINGWRKSQAQVAAFYFSESDASYASRTGRPHDVGVIGVALFRERVPEPVRPPPVSRRSASVEDYARAEKSTADTASAAPMAPMPAPAPAPQAESASADRAAEASAAPADQSAKRAPSASASASANAQPRTPSLGTGHGALETSHTRTVDFDSATQRPEQIVRFRYDSYANLVAKGVIPAPRGERRPNAFPAQGDDGFVPDPPRW